MRWDAFADRRVWLPLAILGFGVLGAAALVATRPPSELIASARMRASCAWIEGSSVGGSIRMTRRSPSCVAEINVNPSGVNRSSVGSLGTGKRASSLPVVVSCT